MRRLVFDPTLVIYRARLRVWNASLGSLGRPAHVADKRLILCTTQQLGTDRHTYDTSWMCGEGVGSLPGIWMWNQAESRSSVTAPSDNPTGSAFVMMIGRTLEVDDSS